MRYTSYVSPSTERTDLTTSLTRKATKAEGIDWGAKARAAGFTVKVKDYGGTGGVIVSLTKTFAPGDTDAYIDTENEANFLLWEVPVVAYGSKWGSTSDGVGGHAALTSGNFELLQSGISKRFALGAVA